jgi:hypothetical protein
MADTEPPADPETRLRGIEARLADLERGPAPRLADADGTHHRLMDEFAEQGTLDFPEDEILTPEESGVQIAIALWALQVIAKDLDRLPTAVQDTLHAPGQRPTSN